MMQPLLSICIPSYNRPEKITELLTSIDCKPENIEIVICEDFSPQREAIRSAVLNFRQTTAYAIHYSENDKNLGYDANLRHLIEVATGKFVLFMGDDDLFIAGALNQFLTFVEQHHDKKYILRSYRSAHPDGRIENFKYLKNSVIFTPGEKTVAWLFKRSVTICGFTISREKALAAATSDLDGTLLYQVYLMAKVCLFHESIYCDFPVAEMRQSYREDKPMFGNSEAEKKRFTPGTVSFDNSINFTKSYFEITEYLDIHHNTHITPLVKIDLSKYSYPFLSIQRKRGIQPFLRYAKRLETECGFGGTPFYYLYKWGLVILGESLCDRVITSVKKMLGHTPNF